MIYEELSDNAIPYQWTDDDVDHRLPTILRPVLHLVWIFQQGSYRKSQNPVQRRGKIQEEEKEWKRCLTSEHHR